MGIPKNPFGNDFLYWVVKFAQPCSLVLSFVIAYVMKKVNTCMSELSFCGTLWKDKKTNAEQFQRPLLESYARLILLLWTG